MYLTAKEYDLLLIFLKNKNIALSREQLLNKVWGFDYIGETRTVDIHVQRIRDKLDLKNSIKTIFKVGYRLED
ncbi:winged helix-turn-helix domain-containing protein [uncultured Clostridium sp.]|uniref:winged helix-turn-helix domain-containing protein n=1 Tax=uncultured Clostridium sp. TaxID=59620 RepID=UPI003217C603